LATTPCEYGPMAAGAFSVWTIFKLTNRSSNARRTPEW
jgi:hypothetical protein